MNLRFLLAALAIVLCVASFIWSSIPLAVAVIIVAVATLANEGNPK